MPPPRIIPNCLTRVAQQGYSLHFPQTPFISARGYASRPNQSPLKVWPFLAILVAGSGTYVLMVKSRANIPDFRKGKGPKLTPD